MGSDRVRANRKSSSTLTPGFKPKQFSFLQPRYQDQVEPETDSVQENKQQNSSEQANPTPSFLGHSFGRVSVLPIQTKLAIGQAGDKYEQEANRVAAQMMQQINSPQAQQSGGIQRDTVHPNDDKPLQTKPVISTLQRETMPEEDEDELQMKLVNSSIQRQEMPEEEEEEGNQPAQTKRASSVLLTEQRTSNEGAPTKLPEDVKKKMEASFQADFSEVNIYPESQSAKDVGALAYTQGENVHFSPGQFKPDTNSGQELIGHEITHVVQQRQGRVQPTSEVAGMPLNDNNGLESEADSLGKKAAQFSLPDNQKTVESTSSTTATLQNKGDVVQLALPAALAALGAAEWVAIGTAGFAIAASEVGAAASEDVTYTFDEMDGVLLPGGGTDVAKHKADNPDATKYEATHYVAVFVENNWGNRVLGIKFGINFLFDSAGAIGNISLSLEEPYDGVGYGGQVTVNLTSRSLASGASVRVTVNIGSRNSWFLPSTSGNAQFILRGGDGDLSFTRKNGEYIRYEIG